MTEDNTVKFDPGIGDLAINFEDYVNAIFSSITSLRSMSQKRAKFRRFSASIINAAENNIAFYLGCLLWAYYIKTNNAASPKEISENYFLYLTPEQLEAYDYLLRVKFTDNFFNSYERDCLYYTGKKFEIPAQWKEILSIYTEFLELNKGFTKTKDTSDLILPEKLQAKEFNTDLNALIQSAIEKKDLKILFEAW